MSATDAITDFIAAMEIEGVVPSEPVAQRLTSGDLIRFRCEGDGKGRQNGWAIVYLDERPAGAFGNYRLGVSRKWTAGKEVSLSADERRALREEWAQAKQRRQDERDACQREAAIDASEMWAAAIPADRTHPYVASKELEPRSLRVLGDKLLVPMFDSAGQLLNLQRISADGMKRFLPGGRTTGLFCLIGMFSRRGETACIGEGYSTMEAVHRASGFPCIVAFSAKNVGPVAEIWHHARPDLAFIICGDDDAHLPTNVGREAAQAAAAKIGAKLAMPLGRAA